MLVNLTPHTINFVNPEGAEILNLPPSGTVARVATNAQVVGDLDGIPVTHTVYGEIEGLPEPQDGVIYIVSGLVRTACPSRSDLACPGLQVRDSEGRVIGCQSLDM